MNLADVRTVRDGSAYGVDRVIANEEIEVRSILTERIEARGVNVRARLPPTVLTAHDAGLERLVHASARYDAPVRCLDAYPLTAADAPRRGSGRMHLNLGVARTTSQTRQGTMLTLAE
jgi:hypothetical protein